MLEIIVVFVLARKIGKIVADKGRKRIGYQLMLVGFWLGGEFMGALVGAFIQAASGGPAAREFSWPVYICALLGAATGAGIAFAIANSLPPLREDDDFYRGPGPGDYDGRDFDRNYGREWQRPDDQPPRGGEHITDRPPNKQAPADRPPDERIRE